MEPEVKSACDILGLDPYYCASEGRMLAAVAPEAAGEALTLMRSLPEGEGAAVIGKVTRRKSGAVIERTAFGGERIVTRLTGAQLPRIC